MRLVVVLLTAALVVACSTPQTSTQSRDQVKTTTVAPPKSRPDKDGTPEFRPDLHTIEDAIPHFEPVTVAGNKSPYTVLGKTYRIASQPYGYRQRGIASWYGTKFHGEFTSNGEPYDVYSMTAAHKTLPIPCYVRVRNLDNGRSVVVRVNDRGPFHDGRIIDLSYAAAWKLGYSNIGTANVEIELLDPGAPEWIAKRHEMAPASDFNASPTAVSVVQKQMWVQAGAFGTLEGARNMQQRVSAVTGMDAVITRTMSGDRELHRVRVGPLIDPQQAFDAQRKISAANLGNASIVTE